MKYLEFHFFLHLQVVKLSYTGLAGFPHMLLRCFCMVSSVFLGTDVELVKCGSW